MTRDIKLLQLFVAMKRPATEMIASLTAKDAFIIN